MRGELEKSAAIWIREPLSHDDGCHVAICQELCTKSELTRKRAVVLRREGEVIRILVEDVGVDEQGVSNVWVNAWEGHADSCTESPELFERSWMQSSQAHGVLDLSDLSRVDFQKSRYFSSVHYEHPTQILVDVVLH
jgi:hypothetical protein